MLTVTAEGGGRYAESAPRLLQADADREKPNAPKPASWKASIEGCSSAAGAATSKGPGAGPAAFHCLWRRHAARVSPPSSLNARGVLAVHGIGEKKAAEYGADSHVIVDHCRDNGLALERRSTRLRRSAGKGRCRSR